jgi:hypothetical protein
MCSDVRPHHAGEKKGLKRKAKWMAVFTSLWSLLLVTSTSGQITTNLHSGIFKRWIHSHEEDREGVMVFRSSDYNFPPARGRTGFELKEDGEFVAYEIGSDDRSQRVLGHWRSDQQNKLTVYFDNPLNKPYTIEIVSLDHDILKIRKTVK